MKFFLFILFSAFTPINCAYHAINYVKCYQGSRAENNNPENSAIVAQSVDVRKNDQSDNKSTTAINGATRIGLMSLEGEIAKARPIIQALYQLNQDEKIKGLLLHINSGGGKIATGEALFSEIKKLKKAKPVVVIIENDCCSSAYRAAAAADFIFALPSSEVGSIGVKWTLYKFKDIKYTSNNPSNSETALADVYVIRAGKYKATGNSYTPFENEEVEYIKQQLQKQYEQFVKDIAEARNLSIADEKIWADGKYFVGTEALQLGLIDGLGDFTDALAKMKELLESRGVKVEGDFEIVEMKL